MNAEFCFDDCVFTYLISAQAEPEFTKNIPFSSVIVNLTGKTDFNYAEKPGLKVGIIGFAVSAKENISIADIPKYIVDNCETVHDVIEFFKYFAGKYAVIVSDKDKLYLFNDACGFCGIYYDEKSFCISSSEALIAKKQGYNISEEAISIQNNKADYFQPFPYNITHFKEIKILLPNHYLDTSTNLPIRFAPFNIKTVKKEDVDNLIDESIICLKRIFEQYTENYNLVCDLTAGYDSRVNFSFLVNNNKYFECFTAYNNQEDLSKEDIIIAKKITANFNIVHNICKRAIVDSNYYNDICNYFGNLYKPDTFLSGYTMLTNFGKDKATVDGNIMGQIGKSICYGLGHRWGTKTFLLAKQHNFSKESAYYTKKYIQQLKKDGVHKNVFDIFMVENRCARWSTNFSVGADICGVTKLNAFNCRYLIELWMSVPANLRHKQKIIHKTIFEKQNPWLLKIPINPDSKIRLNHKYIMLVATYIKFFATKLKHKLKSKLNKKSLNRLV